MSLFGAAMANPSTTHTNPPTNPTRTTVIATEAMNPSLKKEDQRSRPRLSKRVRDTEPAHIEAVLSRYSEVSPSPANLAQGVAHWDPPPAALHQMEKGVNGGEGLSESANHKYGPAVGLPALRDALLLKLERENGLDMAGQEVFSYSGHHRPRCYERNRYGTLYLLIHGAPAVQPLCLHLGLIGFAAC